MEEQVETRRAGQPYTVKELAEALRVHTDTVYRGVAGRVIKTIPGLGRKVLIPAREAERLINGE